ncbi:MAG: 3-dehydroquinate dehydratase [Rhodospirillales bacterium]|nr:3-dehydroquinate dehydratase [Rhodospirillales bacterium]
MTHIMVLAGPNLNLLGVREPDIYGHETLEDIRSMCEQEAQKHGWSAELRQSNYEGDLVTWIQEARETASAIIINAAAYTHTSIAIHDALKMFEGPIIEVHHSDPSKREAFRHISYIEPLAAAVYKGHGAKGYTMAFDHLASML